MAPGRLFITFRLIPAGGGQRPVRHLSQRRKHNLPLLVPHGAEDRYIPVANALAKAIPDAKLCLTEDAGHRDFTEQSEEVRKEIVSFLKPGKLRRMWRLKLPPVKQKTKQPAERVGAANQKLVSFARARTPRREQGFRESSGGQQAKQPRKDDGTRG